MTQLFVFTAGNPEARAHLADSITSPIDPDLIQSHASPVEHTQIEKAEAKVGGLYAWGAEPGPRNVRTWEQMQPNDGVLCVYDNTYHFLARVVSKFQNQAIAEAIWGRNDTTGNTWEYIYLLTEPEPIDLAVDGLSDVLNRGYMGFTRISDERVQEIVRRYGDVEAFLTYRILQPSGTPPHADALFNVLSTYKEVRGRIRELGPGATLSSS